MRKLRRSSQQHNSSMIASKNSNDNGHCSSFDLDYPLPPQPQKFSLLKPAAVTQPVSRGISPLSNVNTCGNNFVAGQQQSAPAAFQDYVKITPKSYHYPTDSQNLHEFSQSSSTVGTEKQHFVMRAAPKRRDVSAERCHSIAASSATVAEFFSARLGSVGVKLRQSTGCNTGGVAAGVRRPASIAGDPSQIQAIQFSLNSATYRSLPQAVSHLNLDDFLLLPATGNGCGHQQTSYVSYNNYNYNYNNTVRSPCSSQHQLSDNVDPWTKSYNCHQQYQIQKALPTVFYEQSESSYSNEHYADECCCIDADELVTKSLHEPGDRRRHRTQRTVSYLDAVTYSVATAVSASSAAQFCSSSVSEQRAQSKPVANSGERASQNKVILSSGDEFSQPLKSKLSLPQNPYDQISVESSHNKVLTEYSDYEHSFIPHSTTTANSAYQQGIIAAKNNTEMSSTTRVSAGCNTGQRLRAGIAISNGYANISSSSTSGPLMRQRSVCQDDTAVHIQRSGRSATIDSYQLSEDFRQKQLEVLERKYGGHLRARRAATVIQRAWRQFKMAKQFERIRRASAQPQRCPLSAYRCNVSTTDFNLSRTPQSHRASMQQPSSEGKLNAVKWAYCSERRMPSTSYTHLTRLSPHVRVTNMRDASPPRAFTKIHTGNDNVSYTVITDDSNFEQQPVYASSAFGVAQLNLQPYVVTPVSPQRSSPYGAFIPNDCPPGSRPPMVQVRVPGAPMVNEARNRSPCASPLRAAMVKPPAVKVLRQRSVSTERSIHGSRNAVHNIGISVRAANINEYGDIVDVCCAGVPGSSYFSASNNHQQVQVLKPVSSTTGNNNEFLIDRRMLSPTSGKVVCSEGVVTSPHHRGASHMQSFPQSQRQKLQQHHAICSPSGHWLSTSAQTPPSKIQHASDSNAVGRVPAKHQQHHRQSPTVVWLPQQYEQQHCTGNFSDFPTPKSVTVSCATSGPATPGQDKSCSSNSNSSSSVISSSDQVSAFLDLSHASSLTPSTPMAIVDHSGRGGAHTQHHPSDTTPMLSKSVPSAADSGSYLRQWVRKNAVGQAQCQQLQAHSPMKHTPNGGIATQNNSTIDAVAQSTLAIERRITEIEHKRQYRIALNFFNKKPDRGVQLLVDFGFVEGSPAAVAKFLGSRRGLSKQMIGEYLGNLQNPFNVAVLEYFAKLTNLVGLELDVALRKFLSYFRLPGEAQKIERIMEVFSRRYCECNVESASKFRNCDTVFILAFAIIMLNTDLHSPNVKPEKKMKLEDFVKNLKGIDGGQDIDSDLLAEIYHRIKASEFKAGSDHVTQVMKVDRTIVGKKPILALPHRRLVCYCRLYEVIDQKKKQSPNAHQREIFLFNDMLLITKILSRKKNSVTYSYRQSLSLVGMQASTFKGQYYPHGIKLTHTLENRVLHFNARNDEDRQKLMDDLRESIMESDEMEALRIEMELEKQKFCSLNPAAGSRTHSLGRPGAENRDSGLADMDGHATPEVEPQPEKPVLIVAEEPIIERVLEPVGNGLVRRPSVASLDSGMSSTASTSSRELSPQNTVSNNNNNNVIIPVLSPVETIAIIDDGGGVDNTPEIESTPDASAPQTSLPPTEVSTAIAPTPSKEQHSTVSNNNNNNKFSFSGLFNVRNKKQSATSSVSVPIENPPNFVVTEGPSLVPVTASEV